jgi:hypothetical protein
MKHSVLPLLAATAFAASTTLGDEPRQHIDVSKLPEQARLVDDVIVPVPSEVFGVLDKLGWETLSPRVSSPSRRRTPSR